MENNFFSNLRKFIETYEIQNYKLLNVKMDGIQYNSSNLDDNYIQLETYKEIILQEETYLELGGATKTSFSLIYPTSKLELIENGKIHIFGPDISEIKESIIDFGIFIIIGVEGDSDELYSQLKSLNFISNSIKGFQIRSIPRRFWCRISKELITSGFNLGLLGNAIIHLYKAKFKNLVKAIEILIISNNTSLINEFIHLSSTIQEEFRQKFRKKVEEWAKRVDCDYDWGCDICPYQEECYAIKQTLVKREELEF